MQAKFYAVWAAVGPLVGVIIGAWLAALWQRKQWKLNSKRAEYQAALEALDRLRWRLTHHLSLYSKAPFAADANDEKFRGQVAVAEALSSAIGTILMGIFIRPVVLASGIRKDLKIFNKRIRDADPTLSSGEATSAVAQMQLKLLKAAWRDLGLGKPFPGAKDQKEAGKEVGNG